MGVERLQASGLPETVKAGNGNGFILQALDAWAHRHAVKLEFSRPSKPTDNAFIESFNGRLRQECLNQIGFSPSLMQERGSKTGARATTNIDLTVR